MDENSPGFLRQLLQQLLGHNPAAQDNLGKADPEELLILATAEGVTTQIYRTLTQLNTDRLLLETFRGAAVSQSASALMLRQERNRALTALAPCCPVLLKGEVCARLLYPEYPDRPMGDMDVLVQACDLKVIDKTLKGIGYNRLAANQGSLVMPQQSYQLALSGNLVSVIDVHTALFNRPAMRALLDYTQLRQSGFQPKGLPDGIIVPSPAHLLIHAILHLLGHHGDDQRLIWLLDIQLMVNKLDKSDEDFLTGYSHRCRLSATLLHVLENAHTVFPFGNTAILDVLRQQSKAEDSAALDPVQLARNTPLQQALDDWRALKRPSTKLIWLRQHIFPRAEYMISHYSLCRTWSLPFFYLWRILRGAVKLMRPR